MTSLSRYLDAEFPNYPHAHVALIDALRDYIFAVTCVVEDMVTEGIISPEAARSDPHMDRCKNLLAEIENNDFDLSLCGMRKL